MLNTQPPESIEHWNPASFGASDAIRRNLAVSVLQSLIAIRRPHESSRLIVNEAVWLADLLLKRLNGEDA